MRVPFAAFSNKSRPFDSIVLVWCKVVDAPHFCPFVIGCACTCEGYRPAAVNSKPQTSAYQRPPANRAAFAISVNGGIAVVKHPLAVPGLPPERYQAPKNALPAGQLLDDHLEPTLLHHRDKLKILHRNEQPFPAPMPAAAFPFVSRLNALHRAAQAENFRRADDMP